MSLLRNSNDKGTAVGAGVVLLLVIAHSANDAFVNFLSPLLPLIQERFDLGETFLAVLVATISLSANVLQPLFGALSDKLGKRLVASGGLFICSALMPLIGIAPSALLLIALLTVSGLGSAAFHPSASSIMRVATHRRKNKALAFGLFTAAGPLGQALAPIVVLSVVAAHGLGATPWLMLPGFVLALLLYWFIPAQPRALNQAPRKFFDFALLKGPVGALAAAGILRSLSYVTFVSAMPLWLVAQGVERDSPIIGWTLATYSAAAALGVLLGGWLEPRLGRLNIIVGSMLCAIIPSFLTLVLPINHFPFFFAIALASMFANAPVPLMIVSAQDLVPSHSIGTASGLLMGFTWGMAGVFYIGLGRLQEVWGLTPAIGLSYIFLLPAAILAFYVLRKHH